jgi:hypothetical protein
MTSASRSRLVTNLFTQWDGAGALFAHFQWSTRPSFGRQHATAETPKIWRENPRLCVTKVFRTDPGNAALLRVQLCACNIQIRCDSIKTNETAFTNKLRAHWIRWTLVTVQFRTVQFPSNFPTCEHNEGGRRKPLCSVTYPSLTPSAQLCCVVSVLSINFGTYLNVWAERSCL